jgi:anaerobic selenocysteine-containing dehydrogenase
VIVTRAMIRREGVLVEAPLGEALDLVARRLRDTAQRHGKDSVAIYGSAQWTVPDAYVAAKLFKGALGTNNVETSVRLYGASAMAGLESSFGLDGAIGCYEDIDHADVFVLWDDNLAEDGALSACWKAKRSALRIVDLATRTTRTSYASTNPAAPQADWRSPTRCHVLVASATSWTGTWRSNGGEPGSVRRCRTARSWRTRSRIPPGTSSWRS